MVSLSNRKDILANSLGIITPTDVIDVGDGLTSIAEALGKRADKTAVYLKQKRTTDKKSLT